MQLSVLIEPIKGNGYRVRAFGAVRAECRWSDQRRGAEQAQSGLDARVRAGAEVVTVEVDVPAHPWAEFAGMFKDNPDFQDVLEIMAENRRTMDADSDIP